MQGRINHRGTEGTEWHREEPKEIPLCVSVSPYLCGEIGMGAGGKRAGGGCWRCQLLLPLFAGAVPATAADSVPVSIGALPTLTRFLMNNGWAGGGRPEGLYEGGKLADASGV